MGDGGAGHICLAGPNKQQIVVCTRLCCVLPGPVVDALFLDDVAHH